MGGSVGCRYDPGISGCLALMLERGLLISGQGYTV